MRSLLFLLPLAGTFALAAEQAKKCGEDGGNWYCQPVQRIKYTGVGASGTYDEVVGMDAAKGTCQFSKQPFSGEMAPFDEDLSMHFRGPLVLKQFAVYKSVKAKRKRSEPPERHHHHHHAGDKLKHEHAKKAVGDIVTATINGQVVSWVNEYDGHDLAAATDVPAIEQTVPGVQVADPIAKAMEPSTTTVTITVPAPDCAFNAPVSTSTSTASSPAPSPSSSVSPSIASAPVASPSASAASNPLDDTNWEQLAYYNKDNTTAEGLVFLNNLGANGLTFASADGTRGASSAEVFNGELKSQQEIAIFSSTSCNNGNCGFSRPGSTANEGFAGAEKAFFLEFSMPNDGATEGFNMNMPGVWLLNGKIPRTQQYGDCSCWKSGCGEFDVFETLAPGDERAKSTFHKRHAGGSSDYFTRPMDSFIQLAVVMYKNDITVQQLGNGFGFPQSISADDIAEIHDDENLDGSIANSIYNLGAR